MFCSIGDTFARCNLCLSDFSIAHGGKNDVTTHINGKQHKLNASAASSSGTVSSMFQSQLSDSQIEAEARWSLFVAKHNLAFLTSDHANKLFPKIFHDSAIAKKFSCGRTKTTAIIKEALAPHYLENVVSSMSSPYSIMMDESNDKTDKSCIILVRVLDSQEARVCTRFLDMPIVNIGSAPNLFAALKSSLAKHGLDFSKSVAFMSDTTNVMKGARSGVQKLIKKEHPSLYDVGCICHLANLTIKAGLGSLPIDIDQLFVDIFYYFYHSSKRKQLFHDNWCSLFTNEPSTILKHCPTRWLSLLRCVQRYISQLDGLLSYFLSCDEADTQKVSSIIRRLQNPLTKPILLFLSHVLPSMDRFNQVFQKSNENTTCILYTETSRLLKLYAANLLTRDVILAAGDNLKSLSLDKRGQLTDENLGIGAATWACLSELEETQDISPFFNAVRKFYVETIKKMLKKFPFDDSLMKDLEVLQPEKTSDYDVSTLIALARRFPQLEINTNEMIDKLTEEFLDFQLSPGDLPSVQCYKAADGTEKPRVGLFWSQVGTLTTLDGQARFAILFKLMSGLLSIPCSNADSERGFSLLRKIHTDQRASLDQSTIAALMSVKMNCTNCCTEAQIEKELLKKCKKATVSYLHKTTNK